MLEKLYKRDSKGKVRISTIELIERVTGDVILDRRSGLIDGKRTQEINEITEGKAGRSTLEQATLEFNSKVKKLKDKGYKTVEEYCSLAKVPDSEFTYDLIPKISTTGDGGHKPMLAQSLKKELDFENKRYTSQPKLNGVRCNIYKVGEDIVAKSRQGKDYTVSCRYIIEELIDMFVEFPNLFLDGEIYIHRVPLQDISGWVRKQTPIEEHKKLEYHIYDSLLDINVNQPFETRANNLAFGSLEILKNVRHSTFNSMEELIRIEDYTLLEGYEGVMVRDLDGLYEFGKRSKTLLKLKKFIDEEFIILGYEFGRRQEDLVFICVQEEGKTFKVKMTGTKEFKASLDLEGCISKPLTVKYFERTKENIPFHGVGIEIRDYE